MKINRLYLGLGIATSFGAIASMLVEINGDGNILNTISGIWNVIFSSVIIPLSITNENNKNKSTETFK